MHSPILLNISTLSSSVKNRQQEPMVYTSRSKEPCATKTELPASQKNLHRFTPQVQSLSLTIKEKLLHHLLLYAPSHMSFPLYKGSVFCLFNRASQNMQNEPSSLILLTLTCSLSLCMLNTGKVIQNDWLYKPHMDKTQTHPLMTTQLLFFFFFNHLTR